jgi:uncharacterized protein (DUF433 family)
MRGHEITIRPAIGGGHPRIRGCPEPPRCG